MLHRPTPWRRAIAAVAVALALVACTDSKTATTATSVRGASSGSSPSPSSSAATTRPFAVTRRDVVVHERPDRPLPLMLLIPEGRGPFPLFEFSHGVNSDGPRYLDFLEPIAAAGYVVVAPTFPFSSGPKGTVDDYPNQAADSYFAIDSVLQMNDDPSDGLHGRVDGEHLAMGGHSLGALTAFGAVYNSCCAQPRIDAALLVAGIELPFTGGNYNHRPGVPLLLTHGDADQRVPVSGSDNLFARATGPVGYLKVKGGTHSGVLDGDQGKLLDQAFIAWLDRWLRDDPSGLEQLQATVAASGLATFRSR